MDLREARCVEQSLVEAFCKRYELLYYEVSAKSGENIEDAFKVFASVLLKKKLAKIEVILIYMYLLVIRSTPKECVLLQLHI